MIVKTFQEILDDLVKKSVENLTESDIAFLKARQVYLSETYKTKFRDILQPKKGTNVKKR